MLCSNCGKNEANVRYTRIINGEKTEYSLCEECAKKLGIDDIDFSMPINFSNFLSDFFEEDSLLPSFTSNFVNECPKCGMTYEEFAQSGKFGCSECYNAFSNKIDSVLKNLHGTSKHVGRSPKNILTSADNKNQKDVQNVKIENNEKNEKQEKIKELNNEIQKAIKEERYEDAAKYRDEIKKIESGK